MPAIAESSITRVRQQASLLDVVQTYVRLKKQGNEYVGLSPFTDEKTPSFFVNPQKNVWYCYSSQQGGNVISFLQKMENLSFPEAIEALAGRFNLPLEYESGGPREAPSLRRQLFAIHDEAADYFHKVFTSSLGKSIRAYWTEKRRFSLDLAAEFGIGVSPPEGGNLLARLIDKGYELEALVKCGLFYTRDRENEPKRLKPRFRGRLMVPIRDIQGRIVGFTARQTAWTPEDDPTHQAKYINSPETPLFDKGRLLFNLDRARTEASKDQPFLMVEGQLDALRCWDCGAKSAIAPQGTSVTEDQLSLLRRYDAPVDVLLDGDAAGTRAALRLLPLSVRAGVKMNVVALPPGDDPDSFLLHRGADALAELRRAGRPLLEVYAEAFREKHGNDLSGAALNEIFSILDQAHSPEEVAQITQRLTGILGLSEKNRSTNTLGDLYSKYLTEKSRYRGTKEASVEEPPEEARQPPQDNFEKRLTSAELDLLLEVLVTPHLAADVVDKLPPEWIDETAPGGLALQRLLAEIAEDQWDESRDWTELCQGLPDQEIIARTIRERERVGAQPLDPVRIYNRLLAALCRKHCERSIRKLRQQIANLTATSDELPTVKQQLRAAQHLRLHPPQIHTDFTPPFAHE